MAVCIPGVLPPLLVSSDRQTQPPTRRVTTPGTVKESWPNSGRRGGSRAPAQPRGARPRSTPRPPAHPALRCLLPRSCGCGPSSASAARWMGGRGAPVQRAGSCRGHIPSSCVGPAGSLPPEKRGLTSRGRPEREESSWGDRGRERGDEEQNGPERAPPRALAGGLRNGNPCQPPQGRGLRRRGTGRTSGRGNPQHGVAWMPLCVTKFGKNMDPSQSFHVCSQLPAEKAKGSLPGKPIRLLREPLNRAEEEKARFQKEELFTIEANWVPHRHSVSYTKTKFWRSEVQNESHWAKIQELAGLCSLLEALRGRICFLALSSFQRPPACLGWWPLSSSLQRAERSAEYINCFGGKDRPAQPMKFPI
ncbi:uncharacterized protein LOC131507217 isoform X3 [Neofelis nebulosa]|uniref:uncharacterized protein LOC131507217 isoform X3 n=1 Tax=Neofelis nebulosa TaxID=61452 RepID=UPI00272ABFE6|nr:uncharacterized protein LOC131507217 isoform X3 [Neofelis nebulosa]